MSKDTINKSNLEDGPHLLKNPIFLTILGTFLLAKVLLSLFWPSQQMPLASDLNTENILNAVNKERSLRNLVTLTTNSKLGSAAQSKTDDMQARHYFAHLDPDGHYIWDKIVEAGYTPYLQLGENLAIEFYDTNSLMSAWMNSPSHRANIIQEGFKDQGMGLTFGNTQTGQYYSAIANTFGTQKLPTKIKTETPPPTTPPIQEPVTQTPKPESIPATKPAAPPKQIEPTVPVATEVPIIQPRQEETRGVADSTISEPNFALPQVTHSTDSSTTPLQESKSFPSSDMTALVGETQKPVQTNKEAYRYITLLCSGGLLFLMLSDLRKAVQNKLGSLDKKINNLIVLLISIIVIAFMYWL